MARREPGIDEEKKSYAGLWLVLSLLLFVAALWALADDNLLRRPWKYYQAEFGRLEIERVKGEIAAEQERLDASEPYQTAKQRLADAQRDVSSGATAARLAELRADLERTRLDDLEKDLNLRFVKSELEELRFLYDDAHHHGRDDEAESILEQIHAKEELQVERQHIFAQSQERIATLEAEIKQIGAEVKEAEDAIGDLAATRVELEQKLEQISLGKLPGPAGEPPFVAVDWQPRIPKIHQVVLDEFDRNAYNQPVARVDRCESCHVAINKKGFDDLENPWKTHPNRDLLLGRHLTEKYGCTPCHNGNGPAVNGVVQAHANYYDEDGHLHEVHLREGLALYRGTMMQANCLKCHGSATTLEGAEVAGRGETLFVELGCHGCHLAAGYEDIARIDGRPAIGPSLRRVGAKADPAWLVRWITNPHAFRPRSRMPNFLFDEEQSLAIAAYLLDATAEESAAWLERNPPPVIDRSAGAVARGEALASSIGCRACHGLAPGEVASQVGTNKDIAPNLSRIAEKTQARWIYHWIRNPRDYAELSRMPSLRLTADEASDITAYLLTLGRPEPGPPDLRARLSDPEAIATGLRLVRQYGCAGCHDIPGMENESRVGAELSTYGAKPPEELFFGDRTDLSHDWQTFTFNKIREPRGFATKWIEQAMPHFALADEDIEALVVFLKGRTETIVPEDYRANLPGEDAIVRGQRLVARYNCTGCHVIEGKGGFVRRLYEKDPASAPPNLLGEGRKVQAPWLFGFLKAPVTVRPWLEIRMPTFGLTDRESFELVRYFEALDGVAVPFVHVEPAAYEGPTVEAGRLLATEDYLACFSCHVRGDSFPEGSRDSWAPNLALAHERLRPDWVLDWIRDPQALLPGTKMPTFYSDPDNPDGPEDILGGDDDAQMRALRDYVISIGLHGEPPSPGQLARVAMDGPVVEGGAQ